MTKTPQNRRILVTGANGRLGRLLRGAARGCVQSQVESLFVARSGPSDLPPFEAGAIPHDLPPVDMVVGLWGVTSGDPTALAANADLVHATHALARASGAHVAIHLSSAGVYGPGEDLCETGVPVPASDYGRAKLDMETAVAALPADDVTHCCLRLANVVGADSLAPALLGDGPVTLTRFEDGRGPLRSYIAPGHLLQLLGALAALPAAALPPVLNVAASTPVEMEALAMAAGKTVTWTPASPTDRQRVTLSTTRLARLLPGLRLPRSAAEMIADWQEAQART